MKTRGQLVITDGAAYQSDIIDCTIILNDLNALGVLLFSSKPLLQGQTVNRTIQHPKLFYVKGIISSCTQVLRPQAVLTTTSYPYRVYIRFQLKGFEELVVVRNYCHDIKTNLISPDAITQKPQN